MPFGRHPTFVPAPTEDSKLWRYMSLPKYLSLLQEKALFFSNLELMARADPFEGTLPPSRFQHRKWENLADMPDEVAKRVPGFLPRGETDLNVGFSGYISLAELRIRQAYAYRRSYFVTCWHLSQHESSAMWDVYSRRNEGIAIVSSEARIASAISSCAPSIFGGQIRYRDYTSEEFEMDGDNAFTPILHKRISFSYEAEYRLVYWDTSLMDKELHARNGVFVWNGKMIQDIEGRGRIRVPKELEEIEAIEPHSGHNISCDINALVSEVYVSPLAEDWLVEVIRHASEVYGLKAPIMRSELLSEPLR